MKALKRRRKGARQKSWEGPRTGTLAEVMARFEAEVIACALEWAGWNRRQVARALDIGYSTLKTKINTLPGSWHKEHQEQKAEFARRQKLRRMETPRPQRTARRQTSIELTQQERFVAQHRLLAEKPLTYRDLARQLGGLSTERIRQIRVSAERKLSAALGARKAAV